MTCKESCIHYDVCQYHIDEETDMTVAECGKFKNKADFVEVVRCEKCKYGDVSTISKTIDGKEDITCYCNLKGIVTDINSFCSSGKRRDT